jgi:hypothetical protein
MKSMLGNTGIEVPPLVFGGNVSGWTANAATAFAAAAEFERWQGTLGPH